MNSLKYQTRNKCSKGIKTKVEVSNTLPKTGKGSYMLMQTRLKYYFPYKAYKPHGDYQANDHDNWFGCCMHMHPPHPPTRHQSSRLAPRDHEEIDTRMILHIGDAVNKGFKKSYYVQWIPMWSSGLLCIIHESQVDFLPSW